MMDLLEGGTLALLRRSLDAASLRERVIANNIANVDTPRFKRSEVQFEQVLRQYLQRTEKGTSRTVMARTHPNHMDAVGAGAEIPTAVVKVDHSTAMNNNLNNVDIDYEMALMAENQLYYYTLIQQVNHEIRSLRTAIGGRV